jgi:hypothetical protein
MKKILLLALAFPAYSGFSQTVTPVVLSNNGGFSQTAGGSIAWTIGEPVSETYTKPTNITTMGFHQTNLDIVALVKEQTADESGFIVFPNPVQDLLKISFKGMNSGTYSVQLNDAAGRQIMLETAEISGSSTSLEMRVNEIAAGNYFLVVKGESFSKAIKITKVY